MAGNAGVHDDATLAAQAADGDRDAFGALFERHVDEVFATAWRVVGDREIAAKVARDAFVRAWRDVLDTPPESFVAGLLERADRIARAWRGPEPELPPTYEAPALGPVHRARLVALLQMDGIPTSVKRRPVAATRTGSQVRWGAAALVAVSLVGVGLVRYLGGAEGADAGPDDTGVEVAAEAGAKSTSSADDDDTTTTTSVEALDDTDGDPSASTTTTTTGVATGTSPSPAGERPLSPGPTTPPSSTATAPTTTTSTGPLPDPVIGGFDGHIYGATCGSGRFIVSMWWDTEFATTARLRPRDGTRITVAVDGTYDACAAVGDEWVLNAINDTSTETATFVVRAP